MSKTSIKQIQKEDSDTGSVCEAASTVVDQRNIEYVEQNCQALITQKKYKETIDGYKKILEIKPDSVCAH